MFLSFRRLGHWRRLQNSHDDTFSLLATYEDGSLCLPRSLHGEGVRPHLRLPPFEWLREHLAQRDGPTLAYDAYAKPGRPQAAAGVDVPVVALPKISTRGAHHRADSWDPEEIAQNLYLLRPSTA